MTTVLIITAALSLVAALIFAGLALRLSPHRRVPTQRPAPTAEEIAEAMHQADRRVWSPASNMINGSNPIYTRHAQVALALLAGREVTRRG